MINTYNFFSTYRRIIKICVVILFFASEIFSQNLVVENFLTPSDTLNKKRFYTSATIGTVTYSGFTIGLYNAWYKNYDQKAFHLFNDSDEWRAMDKFGHFYTAYFQGVLCYKGAKWTGLNERQSIMTGFMLGSLFQTTLEVMDGYSAKWGFSLPDMAMNILGSSAFVAQQSVWNEQRISFKVSNIPLAYSQDPILSLDGTTTSSLQRRSENLYGRSFPEKFLKDYNSQVIWASINIKSFLGDESRFPSWLNLAVGYGAANMFGGTQNRWTEGDKIFDVEKQNPRYSSIYLSPDIDLWKIRSRYKSVNSLLDIFNIFKIPAPAIEYNTLGEFHFHFFI